MFFAIQNLVYIQSSTLYDMIGTAVYETLINTETLSPKTTPKRL